MAINNNNGIIYLFGGATSDASIVNEFWSYNTTSGKWAYLGNAGAPSPRTGAALSVDASSNAIYLFGGRQNDTVFCNDLVRYLEIFL